MRKLQGKLEQSFQQSNDANATLALELETA
jgi:hypothetical protein